MIDEFKRGIMNTTWRLMVWTVAFMGQAVEYEIANVVDPSFTVVSKIRKSFLRR